MRVWLHKGPPGVHCFCQVPWELFQKHLLLLLLLVSYSGYSINQNCLTIVPYSPQLLVRASHWSYIHRWPAKRMGGKKLLQIWVYYLTQNKTWSGSFVKQQIMHLSQKQNRFPNSNFVCFNVLFFKIYGGFYYTATNLDSIFHLPKLPIRKYIYIYIFSFLINF